MKILPMMNIRHIKSNTAVPSAAISLAEIENGELGERNIFDDVDVD
jgi:hypothetical protein